MLKTVRGENDDLRSHNIELKDVIAKLNIDIAKLEARVLVPDEPFPRKDLPVEGNSRRWS
jgi:hypothetical protein